MFPLYIKKIVFSLIRDDAWSDDSANRRLKLVNHCELWMVLPRDGIFNKYIWKIKIFGDKPDLTSLCRPQVPRGLA
jgi:hypothetical protein